MLTARFWAQKAALPAEQEAAAQFQAAEEAANAPGYVRQLKREMRQRQRKEDGEAPSPSAQRNEGRPGYNDASPITRHAESAGTDDTPAPVAKQATRRSLKMGFGPAPPARGDAAGESADAAAPANDCHVQ